jgi:predicted RNase H-related nuclease YkuK (DUF458 family)
MAYRFRSLSDHQEVELTTYIADFLRVHPSAELLVGCDSQNHDGATHFAVVVGLHIPGRGARVLYARWTTRLMYDICTRLLEEVRHSVEVAENIRTGIDVTVSWIDIDVNPDARYESNRIFSSAVGLVTGMGYRVRHKGDSPLMTHAADQLVK